ncbi:MAG: hypothetical protein CMI18_10330 [Opitutaceae bacterium]|nr:hypothetical protein [Opitutaceae bacterium]
MAGLSDSKLGGNPISTIRRKFVFGDYPLRMQLSLVVNDSEVLKACEFVKDFSAKITSSSSKKVALYSLWKPRKNVLF